MNPSFDPTRRTFVQLGLAALACTTVTPTMGALPEWTKGTRSLALRNLHTDERLHVDYWRAGAYNPSALAQINHVLRDHIAEEARAMDVRLIDILHNLQTELGTEAPLEIISGYRVLQPEDTAHGSYHALGKAVDIAVSGTPLSKLHRSAMALRAGGVTFYPDAHFVHLDVGLPKAAMLA
jgi:uncharacterized protein YcbK (DUF882 family)